MCSSLSSDLTCLFLIGECRDALYCRILASNNENYQMNRARAGGRAFSLFSIFFFQIGDVPDYKGGEENAIIIILNNNIIIVYVEIIHMDASNPYLVQCAEYW